MKWYRGVGAVVLSLCLGGAALSAADIKHAEPKLMVRNTPIASALLISAYRYLGKQQRFSIDAVTTNEDMYGKVMMVTYTHHIHIDMQRPKKLHIEMYGDLKYKSYYLNSGIFTVYDKNLNYFATLKVPEKTDDALDFLFEKFNIKTSLANILYRDLERRIPPAGKGYYFGLSDVDEILCHHIGFVTKNQEFQVWIEQGERPLIRKFIVIDKTEPHLPRSGTVLRWNLDPSFTSVTFRFERPADAVRINIEPVNEEAER